MGTTTVVKTRDWYPGAALFLAVYDADGGALKARTAMTESPAGSGSFALKITDWDTSWVGRIQYDDGILYENESIGEPVITSNPGGLTQEQSNLLTAIDEAIGTLTPEERAALADAIFARNVSYSEGTAPRTSLATAILAATNKANTTDHPGKLTVYRTDGTTEHAQIPLTTSPGATPVSGVG